MGLKFRKSIKVAPGVKLNLNTKSSSVTLGTKGAHCTVNTTGKKTTSVGIPGTGISYVSTTGGGKKQETKSNKKTASKTSPTTKAKPSKGSSKKSGEKIAKGSTKTQPKKKGGCLATCLLIFTILCLIFAIIPSGDKKEEAKESNQQKITEEQTAENATLQSDSIETTESSIDDTSEDVPEINAESDPAAITQPKNTSEMVWLPESGTKYHRNSSCSNMDNPRQATLDEAVNTGYEPCKKCY
ncbi:MAG: DUF4236 domain-containing protein [Dorea sp.]|jgi:hypothetical protein|nr:DUF4236 domain-containing protein [Dorea sp.]